MVAAASITTRDRIGIDTGSGIARTVVRIAVVAAFATIAVILLGSQANASECGSDEEASDCTAQPEVAQQDQGDEEEGLPANDVGVPSNAVPPTTVDPSAETIEDGLGAASSPGGVMAPTPVPSNQALVAGQDGPAPVEEIDRPTQQAVSSVAASSSSVPPVGTSSGAAATNDADAAMVSSTTHSPPSASLPAPEGEVVTDLIATGQSVLPESLDPVVDNLKPTVNSVAGTVTDTTDEVVSDVPDIGIPIVDPELPGLLGLGDGPNSSTTAGSTGGNGQNGSGDDATTGEPFLLHLFPVPSWSPAAASAHGVPHGLSAPPPQSGGSAYDEQSRSFNDAIRSQVEHGSLDDRDSKQQDGVPAPVPTQIPATPTAPSSHGGSSGPSGGGSDLGQADLDAHRLPGTAHLKAASHEVWRLPGSPSFEPGHSPD